MNNWHLYFEDFKRWLEDEAVTLNKKKGLISYSTKNHSIRTLNTFLSFMKIQNLIDPSNVYKVSGFPAYKIGSRNAEHLISREEFEAIKDILNKTNREVAVFWETAYWTGMRFNEIFGLSMDDIIAGKLEDKVLGPAMNALKIDYYGYILLQSQPADKIRSRQTDGSIKRKPLKGKPAISTKHDRIIPIINKDLYNNLVKLYKTQEGNLKNRKYGTNLKNYVLFENLTYAGTVLALRQAYLKTKYTVKSYHCCRHTRCTELVGQTRDFVLARYWLGHARQETTLRYTHIYQESANMVKKKEQKIEFVS